MFHNCVWISGFPSNQQNKPIVSKSFQQMTRDSTTGLVSVRILVLFSTAFTSGASKGIDRAQRPPPLIDPRFLHNISIFLSDYNHKTKKLQRQPDKYQHTMAEVYPSIGGVSDAFGSVSRNLGHYLSSKGMTGYGAGSTAAEVCSEKSGSM